MGFISFSIENIRCISAAAVEPIPEFNLFIGKNGSGKTSILEALHIIATGYSFRHYQINTVIQDNQPHLSVSGLFKENKENLDDPTHQIGIQKTKNNQSIIRINQASLKNISTLASLLPLQVIHPNSDEVVTGGSKNRRQFMDWGVFHLEAGFYPEWKKLNLLLKQRNTLLKARTSSDELSAWNKVYAQSCEIVSNYRRNYIDLFRPYFEETLKIFTRLPFLRLEYQQGWPIPPEGCFTDLLKLLEKNYHRDIQLGHTSLGTHRDELKIYAGDRPAAEVLSRGEQKLLVIALKLAQGKLLNYLTQKSCLFLLDDFSAELDKEHRYLVIQKLAGINSQTFMTSIEFDEIKSAFEGVSAKVFHVEQGQIKNMRGSKT